MNLYRLDYVNGEAVRDAMWRSDALFSRYAAACRRAQAAADAENESVQVTRISGGGLMKVVRTVHPA